jgi:hypothetical protein
MSDGRAPVGTVLLSSSEFVAVNTSGEIMGAFSTLAAAVRSFPAAVSSC